MVAVFALAGCGDELGPEDLPQPAAIEIVSGNNQIQGRDRTLHEPIVVRAVDASGAAIAGATLVFTPGHGSGVVSVASVVTDSVREASVEWTLGGVVGTQTLSVASADGSADVMVSATARPGDFDIQVVFGTSLTVEQQAAVRAGVERWTRVIVNDLPDVSFRQGYVPANHCSTAGGLRIAPGETVDDVVLAFGIRASGVHGVAAATCHWRSGSGDPTLGLLNTLDSAALSAVVAHYTGHLLGFGWRWGESLLDKPVRYNGNGVDTHFPDPLTVAAFDAAGGRDWAGGTKVPVENYEYLPGPADYHWRGEVLQDECMELPLEPFERQPAPERDHGTVHGRAGLRCRSEHGGSIHSPHRWHIAANHGSGYPSGTGKLYVHRRSGEDLRRTGPSGRHRLQIGVTPDRTFPVILCD